MKNEAPIVLVSAAVKGAKAKLVDLSDRVLGFSFEDSDVKTDKAVFTVRNDDLANFDTPLWRAGMELIVQFGYFNNLSAARRVIVKKVTGFSVLSVECHGKACLMNEVKRTVVYKQKTRSQLVAEIAESYGYGPDAQFITQTNRLHGAISSGGLSDGELLAKLAKAEGFQFYIDHTGLHWHAREFNKPPIRTFAWESARENAEAVIDEPRVDVDLTVSRPKAIRARGVDRKTGKPFEVVASNTETDRDGLAATTEGLDDWSSMVTPGGEGGGLSEVPEAADDNVIEVVDPRDKTTSLLLNEQALLEGVEEVSDTSSHTAEDAKAKVDGRFRKLRETTVKMSFSALGDPSFGAKQVFRFECKSKRLTGNYYAKEVTHTIAPGSYTMEIKAISDGTSGSGKKSAAKVNTKVPADSGAGDKSTEEAQHELEEKEQIDPRDKTTSTYWE